MTTIEPKYSWLMNILACLPKTEDIYFSVYLKIWTFSILISCVLNQFINTFHRFLYNCLEISHEALVIEYAKTDFHPRPLAIGYCPCVPLFVNHEFFALISSAPHPQLLIWASDGILAFDVALVKALLKMVTRKKSLAGSDQFCVSQVTKRKYLYQKTNPLLSHRYVDFWYA